MYPIIDKLGFDPIWFAIVAILTIEIGLITPPFGMVVFAMVSALEGKVEVTEIFMGAAPFIILLLMAVAIIIAFPRLVTWLPSFM